MPVSANLTRTFDGELTMGTDLWNRDTFTDALTGHSPLLKMLEAFGSIKTLTGGIGNPFVVEPLCFETGTGPTPQGISDEFAELPVVPLQGYSSSLWQLAEKAAILAIGIREFKQLGSKTAKLDLFQRKFEIFRKRFIKIIYKEMFAAENAAGAVGSATTVASLRTLLNRGNNGSAAAIDEYIDATQIGTAIGTGAPTLVGNIDRAVADNAFWSTPCEAPGSPAAAAASVLMSQITLASRNGDTPKLGLMRPAAWNKYPPILMGIGQTNIWEKSDALKKFDTFRYRGVEFAFDPLMPYNVAGTTTTSQMLVINPEYIAILAASKWPDFMQLPQDKTMTKQWQMSWFLQLIGRHLGNVHARHSNLDAS